MSRYATGSAIRRSRYLGSTLALLMAVGAGAGGCEGAPNTAATAPEQISPRGAVAGSLEVDRLARLEARLEETEARLLEAESRAAAAEAQARRALIGGVAPGAAPALGRPAVGEPMVGDPTVEHRTEAEIKASAVGIDVAAADPPEVAEPYDERLDRPKAEAFNIDPRDDD